MSNVAATVGNWHRAPLLAGQVLLIDAFLGIRLDEFPEQASGVIGFSQRM
jgi:hypothetical protein